MTNLPLKAKIALIVVAPIYIAFLTIVLIFVTSFWLLAQFLNLSGILDAFIYLLTLTRKSAIKTEFMEGLDPLEKAIMKSDK